MGRRREGPGESGGDSCLQGLKGWHVKVASGGYPGPEGMNILESGREGHGAGREEQDACTEH